MARIISTTKLLTTKLDAEEALWVYNGLDCIVTQEIWKELQTSRSEHSDISYNFVRAMQAPALDMMRRGMLIDTAKRSELYLKYRTRQDRLQSILDRLTHAVWGKPLNPNSPKQLIDFFYRTMKLPEQFKFAGGTRRVSTDANALRKLEMYFTAKPICKTILAIRDCVKTLSVINTGMDSDGRMRTSYNIAGTETGRWSSSENAFGTGTNFQNITDMLRVMFIADPGKKLAYVDLEQAESRVVAYLSQDEAYISACESSDLHTTVTKMIWPDLEWTDDEYHNRHVVADQTFFERFSYRDLAKRGGHGTNYYGQARTMAMHLHVNTELMEDFQYQYFKAFPKIKQWHLSVAQGLQTDGFHVTPLGRKRVFFGRPRDDSTLREAIAHVPQSTIGELLNKGLWLVWKHMRKDIQLLAQVHDAILIQYAEDREDEILPEVLKYMTLKAPIHGREMIIPSSADVGWNWAKKKSNNQDGLTGWNEHDNRKRQYRAQTSIMDTILS